MEEELFSIDDKTKLVKALGIEIVAKSSDVHIYVDGKDVLSQLVFDKIVITANVRKAVDPTSDAPATSTSLK
jgi:hypothetical protein